MDPGRELAFAVLRRIEAGVTWRAAWGPARQAAAADARDRRFAFEIASGTTRLRGRLDGEIARHASRAPDSLDPAVRVALRMGLYQLFAADGVAAHAAVHTSVELAKQNVPRAAGLVNAVLRAAQRTGALGPPPSRDLAAWAAWTSHPEWLIRRWWDRFGAGATAVLCEYDNRRPVVCLRTNPLRGTRDALCAQLPDATAGRWSAAAIRLARPGYAAAHAAVDAGLASVQDESAMLVTLALGLEAGMEVLDVAAAPGGKTGHAAECLADRGRVRAFDRTLGKIERIRANARRLGLQCIEAAVGDARRLPVGPDAADAVLVDAPCSGLGVLARRPDLRWRKEEADLARLGDLQLEMLAAAARHVRPGGRLVYSVCSFEPEETTAVAARFTAAFPGFVPHDDGLVLRSGPGISYFLPQEHGTDGGFVALWRRRMKG